MSSTAQPVTPTSIDSTPYDVDRIRADFPILRETVHGHPLVYLDNAATTQKPRAVIDAIRDYYERYNANIHRGVHHLSVKATDNYEAARSQIQRFIGADRHEEIIFLRSATEAINLVAQSFGRKQVSAGDEVVISEMEHHSNIVPWQILCEQTGAKFVVAPMNDDGELMLDKLESLLNSRTKIVAVTHVSNALGTINPIRRIADLAHSVGAAIVVDGAQAAPHMEIDVKELDCDFYAISSHKMFGPTGVGALYGRYDLLSNMPPYQGGGDMIKYVSFDRTQYNDLPFKFEAGTPNIAGAIGFGAAAEYILGIGLENIEFHEQKLLAAAAQTLSAIPRVRLIGTAHEKAAVVAFEIEGIHAHDVGSIMDEQGIAVRTGHHCAQPVMEHFGVAATARASFSMYNTMDEIDAMAEAVKEVIKVLG